MRPIEIGKRKPPAAIEPGPAPMLQWIAIDKLVVDDSYQRELKIGNWKAIEKIAGSFKWSRFSPVFVAPVEGGRFAIIDGQHRTHAAAICGMAQVPCQIVQMNLQEQAASFAAVNGLVTKVTLFQIFKAALTADEPWATECAAICAAANCRLMTSNASADAKRAGDVNAIAWIRNFREKGQGSLVTFALSHLRKADCGAEPGMWSNDVLKSFICAVVDRPWLARKNVDLTSFLDQF